MMNRIDERYRICVRGMVTLREGMDEEMDKKMEREKRWKVNQDIRMTSGRRINCWRD